MKRAFALILALPLSGLALSAPARGEESVRPERPRSTYRLDYVLSDVAAGKRTNERTYSMTVNEGSQGQLRTGTRVPLATEKGVHYQDVGVRLSGRVVERDGDLALDTELEVSSFVLPEAPGEAKGSPTLRSVSQTLSARPTLGKAAVLSTLDDADGRRRLQVEVTVTRVK